MNFGARVCESVFSWHTLKKIFSNRNSNLLLFLFTFA
jgi:hypothetical protein